MARELQKVEVGMFRLPGVSFEYEGMTDELFEEINKWCEENHCGQSMTRTLWSFKTEAQRDWFLLKWS